MADPVEALRRQADSLAERGAVLKRVADSAAPLYQSLDDAQKQRFLVLGRHIWHPSAIGSPGMGSPGGWRGPMGPGGRGEMRGDGDFRGRL